MSSIIHDIWITRHGARIDNGPDADRHWLSKANHNRPQDPNLSPHGEQAARETGQALKEKGVDIQCIISSPLVRCLQTASIIADVLVGTDDGKPKIIKVEPGIAEVGATSSHFASSQELQQQFPLIDPSYQPVMSPEQLPSREFWDSAAAKRSASTVQKIMERFELESTTTSATGSILFVGHGASCLGMVQAFGGSGYVGYCSLTHFQLTGDQWKLAGTFGDVYHLSDRDTARDSAW